MQPENPPSPEHIDPLPGKERFVTAARKVKSLGGRATLLMSAAALATACTTSSSAPKSYEGKPSATYHAQEIPGQPHRHSVSETFKALKGDSHIPKEGQSIDISPIASQYKKSDYVDVISTNPHTKQQDIIDLGSAPVMEIRFDKAKNEFTYATQTPKGLDNQELYQLLLPVMQDNLLLRTAFENGDITRVAVRLEAPPLAGTPADYTSDQFVQQDYSTPKEGMQNTVFLFLPGTRRIDTQEIRDTLRHETIHGLTGKDSLSDSPEAPKTPDPEDLAKWNAACVDMRDFSLQDAEKHKQSAIKTMAELQDQIHNPTIQNILGQITDALRNGTFDRYQPKQGENPNDAFSGKVPDCISIGPWGAFVRLMNAHGLQSYVDKIFETTKVGYLAASLHDDWQNMTEFQTIYKVLREGTYENNSPEKGLGHEFDDWDELVTSTSDVAIGYPKALAQTISELPLGRREVVLNLVKMSLDTLGSQVPETKSSEQFHRLIKERFAYIVNNSV